MSPMNPVNNVNGFPSIGAGRRADARSQRAAARGAGRGRAPPRRGRRRIRQRVLEICNKPYSTNVPADWVRAHDDRRRGRGGKAAAAGAAVAEHRQQSRADGRSASGSLDLQLPLRHAARRDRAERPAAAGDRRQRDRLPRHGGPGGYRSEGWEFVLAGGGLYNNLDYSFTVGHEDGGFQFPSTQPGGGGRRCAGSCPTCAVSSISSTC